MPATAPRQVSEWTSIEPSVTALPVIEDQDGADWHGWGHLDPAAFLQAIDLIDRHWGNEGLTVADRENYLGLVEHLWAVPHPENPEEQWLWVKQGTPHAVPITTITL